MHGGAPYLHALVHQGEDVAAGDQLLDGAAQAFGQAAEEIQGHDHEVFVGGFVLVRLRLVKLGGVCEVIEGRRRTCEKTLPDVRLVSEPVRLPTVACVWPQGGSVAKYSQI